MSEILEAGIVRRIYASFGGGDPVLDFSTIAKLYWDNNRSFARTNLPTHLKALRQAFPAITGIDMDVEDNYDDDSFIAFANWFEGWALTFHFARSAKTNQTIEHFGFGSTACKRLNEAAGARAP